MSPTTTRRRRRWISTTLLVLVMAALPARAGGVYLYEKSATDVGLASAGWTARAGDASTIFSNPAGLSRLEGGNLDVTLMPLHLSAKFTPNDALTTATALGTPGFDAGQHRLQGGRSF